MHTYERRAVSDRRKILFFRNSRTVHQSILVITLLAAATHFFMIAFVFQRGNMLLFSILVLGEIFHIWSALGYIHTIWDTDNKKADFDENFMPPVDVYITVSSEPLDVIEETVRAARRMAYPDFEIYILNDGFVTGNPGWKETETLAKKLGVGCITRKTPGGAKAGNINHAMLQTKAEFIAVFDTDHIPHPEFLRETVGYFADSKMAFVQTPQFYRNRDVNYLTGGAWQQQELFFGPICKGKNRTNSIFMCGTNMVVRKAALVSVGGMNEENIAEDFLTSLFMHQKGWKSTYVSRVLSQGLAPEDFLSYCKQQFRWARGGLDVLFVHNPLMKRGLTWSQKLEYLSSAAYHMSGVIVLLNALFPLVFFFTGVVPFHISTMALAAVFIPYMFLIIYTLQRSSNFSYTFRALSFSMSLFPIHIKALWKTLMREKSGFSVTSKKALSGNFLYLALPHMAYIAAVFIGIAFAVAREGFSASVMNNSAWALFNVAVFVPFIRAAMPARKGSPKETAPLVAALDAYEIPAPAGGQSNTLHDTLHPTP